jgi:hypothetical protein
MFKEFTLPVHIAFDEIDGVEISTVNLKSAAIGNYIYETCIFYSNGDNNVVARYATESEALNGHAGFVSHEKAHLATKQSFG